MSWTWRLEDPAGAAIEPASLGVDVPQTDNQGDAESWLGENWRELLARGGAAGALFGGEDEGYGPLGPAAAQGRGGGRGLRPQGARRDLSGVGEARFPRKARPSHAVPQPREVLAGSRSTTP